MKKRRIGLLFLSMMTAAVLMTGCGAAKRSNDMMFGTAMDMNTESATMQTSKDTGFVSMPEEYVPEASGETDTDLSLPTSDRKLIKTVDMTVETREFDSLLVSMEAKVEELGGYIECMETYNGSTYYEYRRSREASMTLRIPQSKLNGFLDEVSDLCNVIRRSEQVEDVTLTYVDLQSHKKALQAEQERLLELIGRAEQIEEIITIESRLSEVRYQLESMESQLRTFDNKIDYSTVTIYVEEVVQFTPVEEETAWERISSGFVESVEEIGDGLKEFAIWFVISIPYFVVWGVVLLLVIIVIKALHKCRKKHGTCRIGKVNKTAAEDAENVKR